jgi:hypothetical protein
MGGRTPGGDIGLWATFPICIKGRELRGDHYSIFLRRSPVMADATQPVNSQPQVCVTLIEEHSITYTFKCLPASQGITPMQMGNDRNAKNCPIGPDGKRDWSYGLLDCSDRSGLCT